MRVRLLHHRVIRWCERRGSAHDPAWFRRTAAADQYIDQLERFQDAARFVHFGPNLGRDGVLLSMLMIPHQPLIIEAHAEDEETRFLISRCAAALDYEVFAPESVEMKAALDPNGPAEYAVAA